MTDAAPSVVSSLLEAIDLFTDTLRSVPQASWTDETPCAGWAVRDLVNHLTAAHLRARDLLAGRTGEQVGGKYEGDLVGRNPLATWEATAVVAERAWRAADPAGHIHPDGALVPVAEYATGLLLDTAVHTWDVARGGGLDADLPPDTVRLLLPWVQDRLPDLAGGGRLGPSVPVPAGEDPHGVLLGLVGRRP